MLQKKNIHNYYNNTHNAVTQQYSNTVIDNNKHKTRRNWQIPMSEWFWSIQNILICSTETPQLCYKLESSSLWSISFLLGLWYLSWRPWWWESTVNRLSFFPELLLYKIIMGSEKKSLLGLFCAWGSIGKTEYNSSFFSENLAFTLKCNFTSSSTDNSRLFCCNSDCLLLYLFGQPVWNNWVARKVTGNLNRQRGKL